jgi:hypothetical protein
MRLASFLIFILSAVSVVVAACVSVPKPGVSPEDEARSAFKSRGETYFEICETECRLPGLFGDDERLARQAKVEKIASLGGDLPPDAISRFEAANDFANRYNRTMFSLAHPRPEK